MDWKDASSARLSRSLLCVVWTCKLLANRDSFSNLRSPAGHELVAVALDGFRAGSFVESLPADLRRLVATSVLDTITEIQGRLLARVNELAASMLGMNAVSRWHVISEQLDRVASPAAV
jgi:hypothetical protein